MRVHIASDHAGFELKGHLADWLRDEGHDVVDHGAAEYDPDDDYPPYCIDAAAAVVAELGSLGVVLGGSGNGEQIAANKVTGARAVLAWSLETAELGRQHNDANVIAMGARVVAPDMAMEILKSWFDEPFEGGRHEPRLRQIAEIEGEEAG